MKKLLRGFLILTTLPISLVIVSKVWTSKQNKKTASLNEISLTKRTTKEMVEKKDENSIQHQPIKSSTEVLMTENMNDIKPIACDFIVIDIKTTGLDSTLHKITEIAAIKVKAGKITETFQTLIKPYQRPGEPNYQDQKYLNDNIIAITGITEEMLNSAPTIESVLKEFHLFIGDQLLIGHYINFCLGFLKQDIELVLNQSLTNPIVDTLALSSDLLSISNYKLQTVAQYLNIQIDGSHRALADCKTILEVYMSLLTIQPDLTKVNSKAQVKKNTFPHPFYEKKCVFTNLGTMTLRRVKELLEESGGIAQDNVTKSTDFLILGSREKVEQPSVKHKKALEYMAKGQTIEVLDESEFFELLSNNKQA